MCNFCFELLSDAMVTWNFRRDKCILSLISFRSDIVSGCKHYRLLKYYMHWRMARLTENTWDAMKPVFIVHDIWLYLLRNLHVLKLIQIYITLKYLAEINWFCQHKKYLNYTCILASFGARAGPIKSPSMWMKSAALLLLSSSRAVFCGPDPKTCFAHKSLCTKKENPENLCRVEEHG